MKRKRAVPTQDVFGGGCVPLKCAECNSDLLELLTQPKSKATLITVSEYDHEAGGSHIRDIFCACSERCASVVKKRLWPGNEVAVDEKDLNLFTIPMYYLQWVRNIIAGMHQGKLTLSAEAFNSYQLLLLALSQKVLRNTEEAEHEVMDDLAMQGDMCHHWLFL
jgi:hypothetical protein